MRQRATEYKEWVGTFTIIVLILVFGCTLTGIGVRLVAGQRRIERRQAVQDAAIRASLGPPTGPSAGDDAEGPDRRHGLALVPPIAVLAGVALMLRQHWRAVSGVGGALAASAVVLALILGHTPAAAGPPMAGQPTTAGLTGASVPAPSTMTASSSPAASMPAPSAPVPSMVVTDVVFTGDAPAGPRPSAGPSSSVPVPSRSPSVPPSTEPHSPQPSTSPPPSSSAACLVGVTVPSVLGVCLL